MIRTLALAALLLSTPALHACNIPVFRYALERWRSDFIEVVVVRNSDLSDSNAKIVQSLREATQDSGGPSNAIVIDLDLRKELPQQAAYKKHFQSLKKPLTGDDSHVFILSSLGRARQFVVWDGSLSEAANAGVMQSPVRAELGKRLTSGHAVVWLMVRAADEAKNESTRGQLQVAFEKMKESIELPEGIGLPGSELHSDVPLLLRFSVLEIDPVDTKESFLVKFFGEFHPDLKTGEEPLVVPVFGRGRALEVIPNEDLDSSLIVDMTRFLCGACSCQVKDQNPGFDLLMATDWEAKLFEPDQELPPDLSDQRKGLGKPTLLPIPPGRKK